MEPFASSMGEWCSVTCCPAAIPFVFSVLRVSPHLAAVASNILAVSSNVPLVVEYIAASSANWDSVMFVEFSLDFAVRSPTSFRPCYSRCTPACGHSALQLETIAAKYTLNIDGARVHPCLRPLWISNSSVIMGPALTTPCIPS